MKQNLNKAILVALGMTALVGASEQALATTITGSIPVGNASGFTQNGILPYAWDGGNIGYGPAGIPTGSTKGYAYYAPNQARLGGANPMSGTAIENIDSDKNLAWNHNTKWQTFEITAAGGYTVAVDRLGSDTNLQPAFSLFSSGAQKWDAAGSSHSFTQVAGPAESALNATGNATNPPYMVTGGNDITGFVGYVNSGAGYVNGEGFTVLGALDAGTSTKGALKNPALAYNAATNPYTSVITKGAYTNPNAGFIAAEYAGEGSSVNAGNPTLTNANGGGHVDLQLWLTPGFYAIAPGGSCADFTCTATAGISAGINQTVRITVLANANVTAPAAVPVPGAVWLFGSAMVGLIGFGRRKQSV